MTKDNLPPEEKPLLEKLFNPENMNANSLLMSKMTQILEEEKVPKSKRKKILERVEKEIMGIAR